MTLLQYIIKCHSPPKIKTMTKLTGAVPFGSREPGGTKNVMSPT